MVRFEGEGFPATVSPGAQGAGWFGAPRRAPLGNRASTTRGQSLLANLFLTRPHALPEQRPEAFLYLAPPVHRQVAQSILSEIQAQFVPLQRRAFNASEVGEGLVVACHRLESV